MLGSRGAQPRSVPLRQAALPMAPNGRWVARAAKALDEGDSSAPRFAGRPHVLPVAQTREAL